MAERLLGRIVRNRTGSGVVFLDSPEKNPAARRLLQAHGFTEHGGTLLMYRGIAPQYRPEFIYSLASMGSYG